MRNRTAQERCSALIFVYVGLSVCKTSRADCAKLRSDLLGQKTGQERIFVDIAEGPHSQHDDNACVPARCAALFEKPGCGVHTMSFVLAEVSGFPGVNGAGFVGYED